MSIQNFVNPKANINEKTLVALLDSDGDAQRALKGVGMTSDELARKYAEEACTTLNSIGSFTWRNIELVIQVAIKKAVEESNVQKS